MKTGLNLKELVHKVGNRADVTYAEAERVIKAFKDVVAKELRDGKSVTIRGFITFAKEDRKPRPINAFGKQVFTKDYKYTAKLTEAFTKGLE